MLTYWTTQVTKCSWPSVLRIFIRPILQLGKQYIEVSSPIYIARIWVRILHLTVAGHLQADSRVKGNSVVGIAGLAPTHCLHTYLLSLILLFLRSGHKYRDSLSSSANLSFAVDKIHWINLSFLSPSPFALPSSLQPLPPLSPLPFSLPPLFPTHNNSRLL